MTKRERIAAYREAARQIAEDECDQIIHSLDYDNAWAFWPTFATYEKGQVRFSQEWRVLALLLAAEMVRTGDL